MVEDLTEPLLTVCLGLRRHPDALLKLSSYISPVGPSQGAVSPHAGHPSLVDSHEVLWGWVGVPGGHSGSPGPTVAQPCGELTALVADPAGQVPTILEIPAG